MNFRCKFRHHLSIPWPWFSYKVQNFGDLPTFSIDFCILYAEGPPYFYFRFVWPTDSESIPHTSTPHGENFCQVWSWYDNPLLSYSVPANDTLRDLVTWTFDLFTLNSCHTWQVIWPTLPPSLKTLRLSVLELWVMTFSAVYRWKWTCGHCTCAESRDPCVGGQKQLHFWNPRPQFASSLYHFYGARTTIKGHLLLSRPTLNSFSAEKDKSKIGPKIGSFLGKLG